MVREEDSHVEVKKCPHHDGLKQNCRFVPTPSEPKRTAIHLNLIISHVWSTPAVSTVRHLPVCPLHLGLTLASSTPQ